MRGMPFSSVQRKGVLEASNYWKKQQAEVVGVEPRSVLDNRRSPSPSSSSFGGGGAGSSDTAGVAAISDNSNPHKWPPPPPPSAAADQQQKEEWASELQPIIPNSSLEMHASAAPDDWEAMLSDPATSPGQDQTFLRWIMGDIEDSNSAKPHQQLQQQMFFQAQPGLDGINSSLCFGGVIDPSFGFQGAATSSVSAPSMSPVLLPPVPNSLPMFFQEPPEEKPHLFNQGLAMNNQQNQAFFHPLPIQTDHNMIVPPLLKRQQSFQIASETSPKIPFPQNPFPPLQNPMPVPYQLQQRLGKPKDEAAAVAAQQQQQALVDQLFKAAELVENGNSISAREILARLNHQLPSSPFGMKPLLRSAFYFKEALHLLSNSTTSSEPIPTPIFNPWDVVLKLSAYKAFPEVSPLLHFANFTCTQTLLEELADADQIHIVDFDIAVGGHWSSFMQELAHRRSPAIPVLKVTAFVLPSLFHPLELHLTRQNLSHFAADLNIPFELNILGIETFDPIELLATCPTEAIGVNLPVGCHYNVPFPTLLRLVKQLDPKVVVSVERGNDRSDLSFTHSFLHSFQSCMVLLDSIDAAGTSSDVADKIERFMVQPWVEGAVMGRHRAFEKLHPWRSLFNSVGFVPVQFSNFTENQAEWLLKRVQVRGFHVEKRQASLVLYWQRGELGSVSAWRC